MVNLKKHISTSHTTQGKRELVDFFILFPFHCPFNHGIMTLFSKKVVHHEEILEVEAEHWNSWNNWNSSFDSLYKRLASMKATKIITEATGNVICKSRQKMKHQEVSHLFLWFIGKFEFERSENLGETYFCFQCMEMILYVEKMCMR